MEQINFPTIFPVTCHTDFVGAGSTFVAINGFKENGTHFIPKAIERGATTIVVDTHESIAPFESFLHQKNIIVKQVSNTRRELAYASARAAGFPADKLTIIGITGTKGKTTTSFLIRSILQAAGYKTALISTVANYIENQEFKSSLTTPQPDYLHQFLKLCVEHGVTHVVMEVAAQAITMHRVDGIAFDVVIITNIDREHLEFYDSMESYIRAKLQILTFLKPSGVAWINKDNKYLHALNHAQSRFFSIQQKADCSATDMSIDHLLACIYYGDQAFTIECSRLYGRYNIANITAASACALSMGVAIAAIQQALSLFQGVRGRYEEIQLANGARVIIDYAHNPISFEQLLPVLRVQTEQLIVVFGAGGDRDQGRRPIMGRIAAEYADYIILTMDNPRSEQVENIIADIQKGITAKHKVVVEIDREQAIKKAYSLSKRGTIIALLGKGPDEYQIIGNKKIPFKEKEIVLSL